jgi:hypothetical protein
LIIFSLGLKVERQYPRTYRQSAKTVTWGKGMHSSNNSITTGCSESA